MNVGPEAKLDMYNNFDLDKLFDLHLDPPLSEDPLCRIIQEGKEPILTTDFYLTNIEPKPWILPTPPANKDTPEPSGAAAADKLHQLLSQIQYNLEKSDFIPGCYILHKPQFSTSGKKQELLLWILEMLSINFIYAHKRTIHTQNSALMAEGNPKSPKDPTKELSDSDTSEEEQVNPILRTSEEERHYGTISQYMNTEMSPNQ